MGLFLVTFQTGHCERVLSNGSESLKQVHGICSKSDGKVVLVVRGANKVTEFDVVSKQVTTLAGSGHTESRDGCDLTASFSQPTGVCCEKDSHSIFVVDSSSGRFRLITSVQALIKYLQNLWLFLSAFNLTGTKTRLSYDETVTRVQQCYAFHEEASLKVQGIKGSTSQTQGPDGTLSATTLNSVKMILEGLSRLKTKQLNELRQWTQQYGRSVRQNTTRNFSTKDKPGTLPLNLYESAPPEQHSADFDVLLNEDIPAQ